MKAKPRPLNPRVAALVADLQVHDVLLADVLGHKLVNLVPRSNFGFMGCGALGLRGFGFERFTLLEIGTRRLQEASAMLSLNLALWPV